MEFVAFRRLVYKPRHFVSPLSSSLHHRLLSLDKRFNRTITTVPLRSQVIEPQVPSKGDVVIMHGLFGSSSNWRTPSRSLSLKY